MVTGRGKTKRYRPENTAPTTAAVAILSAGPAAGRLEEVGTGVAELFKLTIDGDWETGTAVEAGTGEDGAGHEVGKGIHGVQDTVSQRDAAIVLRV